MKIELVSEVSIDGKITFGMGKSSKDLFNLMTEDDLKYIHSIRSKVDGILVGMNTIRNDNSSLTCRYVKGKNPIRLIPSNSLELRDDFNILNDGYKTIILTTEKNRDRSEKYKSYTNVDFIFAGEDSVDFEKAFEILETEYDIHSIMLEGGGTLNWTLIQKDMVDELVVLRLPIIIGGRNNVSLVDGEGFKHFKASKKYNLKGLEFRNGIVVERYEVA
ncbi:MAG: dihydrofolate reductase family protein [Eubacterium sp.]|nr:dihydrofolate reductase family protein [Eubacterium sp.]